MTSGIVPPDGASYIVLGNPLNEVRSATITSLETGVAQVVSVPALGSAEVAITGAVAISGDSEIYASVALIVSGQNASMAIYDPTNVGNSVLVRFR
jgi:O-acetylhomoserine/O-acetylserine sulfhydrylase-like pyridoxal-dependent enzyme